MSSKSSRKTVSFWILFAFGLFTIGCGKSSVSSFVNSKTRASIARTHGEMKNTLAGMDYFFEQHKAYTIPTQSRMFEDAVVSVEGFEQPINLYSPQKILGFVPQDHCADPKTGLRYASDGKTFFVLVSNGPDGDEDFDERTYNGEPFEKLNAFAYSVSNGLISNGDMFLGKFVSDK